MKSNTPPPRGPPNQKKGVTGSLDGQVGTFTVLANRENGHFLDKSQYLMLENDEWGHNHREIPSNRGPIMQLFHWSNITIFLLCVQEVVTHFIYEVTILSNRGSTMQLFHWSNIAIILEHSIANMQREKMPYFVTEISGSCPAKLLLTIYCVSKKQ